MYSVEIVEADLTREEHQEAVIELIDAYAMDPMGNGEPLAPEVRNALIPGLQQHPTTIIFLAFLGGNAAGIAVCFRGFSTFNARPLINIHDFAVHPDSQNQGVGRVLLDEVEARARLRGCCKMTLEVHDSNDGAKRLYRRFGFGPWDLPTLFVSKPLC